MLKQTKYFLQTNHCRYCPERSFYISGFLDNKWRKSDFERSQQIQQKSNVKMSLIWRKVLQCRTQRIASCTLLISQYFSQGRVSTNGSGRNLRPNWLRAPYTV